MKSSLTNGSIQSTLYLPAGSGVKLGDDIVDSIRDAFVNCALSGATFGTPSVTRVGTVPGNVWQVNVRLPFQFQDVI